MSYFPPFAPAEAGAAFLSAAFAPVWPRNRRVGANSPSLWPTMFSVAYTGMNLYPLCTANVCPTKSGMTVLARDQVFTTRFSLRPFIAATRFVRLSWTYAPFFTDLAIGQVVV